MEFKILGTALLSATLLITACGQNDNSTKKDDDKKSESKSDKKSNDPKKDMKEDKEKSKNDSNEEKQNSTDNSNQSNEQNTNNQQATEQSQQTQQQASQSNHEPTKEEIAKWDKQNVKGGTDYGLIDPEEANAELRKNEEEANARESRIEQINNKMDDPNISDSEYNKLVDEYNELNNE